jgi:bifunctional ADP-heptose synthase (sugar kinase/adenylyltransferase)
MNTSHFFFTPLPTNGRHFIRSAAQKCSSYLKLWHKEKRPGQLERDNASNNEVSVVDSIHCLASLVDNAKVTCSKKRLCSGNAQMVRFRAEKKQCL